MHLGRFFAAVALLFLILLLWHCGVFPQLTFEIQCRKVAGVEVKNPKLWRQYLVERRADLLRSGIPLETWPVTTTDHFTYTSDWVLNRTPKELKNKAFRDDSYLLLKSTGEPVARFRDLRLMYDTIETTMSRNCTTAFPGLYTGLRPRSAPADR
jgi:hypothetical protein